MELVSVKSNFGGDDLGEVESPTSGNGHAVDDNRDSGVPAEAKRDGFFASLVEQSGLAREEGDLAERIVTANFYPSREIRSFPFRFLLALLYEYLVTRRQTSRLRATLQKSMPSAALDRLEATNWNSSPVRMLATVMFGDIQGFTSMCETIAPDDLIGLLNQYFSLVSGPIGSHAGVITQYQGDAFVAVFHIPVMARNHATDAIHAALEIQRLLQHKRFAGEQQIRSRIGIATGEIAAGFVGSSQHANYTIHGDTVNLAARLEQLNKQLGTSILMSQATAMLAGRDVEVRAKGDFLVAGKAQPCTIFEPVDQQQAGGT